MIRSFGAARMAVGTVAWIAPATAARIFGLDPNSDPVVTQLFGVRDFGLGALTATCSGRDLANVPASGSRIDAVDAIGCLRRREQLSTQAKILTAGGAVLFAVIGVGALGGD